MNRWMTIGEGLPPDETPVLVRMRDGVFRVAELRWWYPSHEETFVAFRYWDDPVNDGQLWEWEDIEYWCELPSFPT